MNDAASSINDPQDTELEHQDRLREINTCVYNRNRLRREIKDAEDAYNTALDVVDNKVLTHSPNQLLTHSSNQPRMRMQLQKIVKM